MLIQIMEELSILEKFSKTFWAKFDLIYEQSSQPMHLRIPKDKNKNSGEDWVNHQQVPCCVLYFKMPIYFTLRNPEFPSILCC